MVGSSNEMVRVKYPSKKKQLVIDLCIHMATLATLSSWKKPIETPTKQRKAIKM